MAAHHVDELRIALGSPDGGGLTEKPEQETGDPQPQAETKGCGERAVENRDRARRTAEQDVLGERAMNGCCKSENPLLHQTSAKPPEVSPNANVSPVTMMMMTAMILATGPSTDCRIWFSGCSHGMLEPAAQAGAQSNVARVMRAVVAMARRMRNRRITAGLLGVRGRSRRPARAR